MRGDGIGAAEAGGGGLAGGGGGSPMITFIKTSLRSLYLWLTKLFQCITYVFRKETRKVPNSHPSAVLHID